jgi:hypothetical protein
VSLTTTRDARRAERRLRRALDLKGRPDLLNDDDLFLVRWVECSAYLGLTALGLEAEARAIVAAHRTDR